MAWSYRGTRTAAPPGQLRPLTSLCFSKLRCWIIYYLSSRKQDMNPCGRVVCSVTSHFVSCYVRMHRDNWLWQGRYKNRHTSQTKTCSTNSWKIRGTSGSLVCKNFPSTGGNLASREGSDKRFKKPFIFHFNQSKSTLIKKIHCKLLNLCRRLPIPNNQVKSLMSDHLRLIPPPTKSTLTFAFLFPSVRMEQ